MVALTSYSVLFSLQCFYNTLSPDNAIVIKLHDKYDVIHSMLWPSIAICICGVIFLRLEVLRRGGGSGGSGASLCISKPPDTLPGKGGGNSGSGGGGGGVDGYQGMGDYENSHHNPHHHHQHPHHYQSSHSSHQHHHHHHHHQQPNNGRETVMMQIKQANARSNPSSNHDHNNPTKVTCKIIPKDGSAPTDYLIDKTLSNSLSSLDRLNNQQDTRDNRAKGGKGGGGTNRKGKAIDKSGGALVKNSRSADALKYHQVQQQQGVQGECLPSRRDNHMTPLRQDSNASSNASSKGQETPV